MSKGNVVTCSIVTFERHDDGNVILYSSNTHAILYFSNTLFCSSIQATWLGGSHVNIASEPLDGELIVLLANGSQLILHMSKVLLYFFTRLVSC